MMITRFAKSLPSSRCPDLLDYRRFAEGSGTAAWDFVEVEKRLSAALGEVSRTKAVSQRELADFAAAVADGILHGSDHVFDVLEALDRDDDSLKYNDKRILSSVLVKARELKAAGAPRFHLLTPLTRGRIARIHSQTLNHSGSRCCNRSYSPCRHCRRRIGGRERTVWRRLSTPREDSADGYAACPQRANSPRPFPNDLGVGRWLAVPPEIRRTIADREVDEAAVDLARQQEPVQAATSPSPGETRGPGQTSPATKSSVSWVVVVWASSIRPARRDSIGPVRRT